MPPTAHASVRITVCAVLCAIPSGLPAQTPVGNLDETVISAPRGETNGGTAPILELSGAELESFGVDTLSDLVDALKPMTRSSRGDQVPVVLINGHLAGQAEFKTLPREAIERVEILPETVALQYGFSENQRVLNFILREHYRAVPARASDSGATEGGGQTQFADASLVRLEDQARSTLYASYRAAAWLRDNQRGIDVPGSTDLTLQPAKTDVTLAGTVSGEIGGVASSLEISIDADSTRSLQGQSDLLPLHQSEHDITEYVAAQLTGLVGHYVWGATAYFTHEQSRASSETGFNPDGTASADQTHSGFNVGNLQLSLSGVPLRLPAGPVITNLKLAFQYQGFDTDDALPGIPSTHAALVRTVRSGSLNASIPITAPDQSRRLNPGDLSATFNLALDNVSNVGPLWSVSYGLVWIPVKRIYLDGIITDHKTAPTVQQILAPPVFTPNVETFDFVSDETVYITQITGGGGSLQPTDDQSQSYGVSLGPFLGGTAFTAHYEPNRVRHAIGALPPLTPAVEQAFPERFFRDTSGTLIQLDDRAVNLQRERIDDLKWGFNLRAPIGESRAQRGMSDRVEFSLLDTWYLRDTILIRNGVPRLDLLNGAPIDNNGGQPRHRLDFRTLIYRQGLGAVLSASWRSPTRVASEDPTAPDLLYFSSLGTADLRFFADLGSMPPTRAHAWARGARLYIGVTNLFDHRQWVHDATGATPIAFEPGYLDPPGRVVTVSARKVF
jgi:hypothetical protein